MRKCRRQPGSLRDVFGPPLWRVFLEIGAARWCVRRGWAALKKLRANPRDKQAEGALSGRRSGSKRGRDRGNGDRQSKEAL